MRKKRVVREKVIERHLCTQTKVKLNGRAPKYVTPSRRSAPDRLLMYPNGGVCFVELKRPGKKPTPLQWIEIKKMWESGHNCTWVDTKEKVDMLIAALVMGEKIDAEFTEWLHA